jgi:centromeric protein E
LCYGEEGTGKSRALLGDDKTSGIIQLTLETIFAFIEVTPEKEFMVRGSSFEISNEIINDLRSNTEITINEKGEIEGLAELMYNKPIDDVDLINKMKVMKVERRSHSELVYRIVVESRNRTGSTVTISTINLIKLSCSDYLSAETDITPKESHKSLDALNEVMQKLSKTNARKIPGPVPYDDSKLTLYLKTALEGNSRTAVLCTMSPAYTSYEKTMMTFCFAMRARGVVLTPKPNLTEDKLISHLLKLNSEGEEIRRVLVSSEMSSNVEVTNLSTNESEDINTKMEQEIEMSMEIQKRVKQVYELKKFQEILKEPIFDEENLLTMKDIVDPLLGHRFIVNEQQLEELKDVLVEAEKAYIEETTSECSKDLEVKYSFTYRIFKTTLNTLSN